MDAQTKRGMLDACVLKAIEMRGRSYGYQITKDVQTCVSTTESTLYPILRRLESSGLVEAESEAFNGRLRRYYTVTANGEERIRQFIDEWEEISRIYRFVSEDKVVMYEKE